MKIYFRIFLLFFYVSATHAASPIVTDVSAGYTYDDNVTRAWRDQDIESDSILEVGASAAYSLPLNDMSYISLRGSADINHYLDFDKLNNNVLGLHASFHIRPTPGYTSLRYMASISFEQRMYDSDQRDGSAVIMQLGLSKRLTDKFSMRAGFINESHDANHIVFDTDTDRIYFDLDFVINSQNTSYFTLTLIDGDLVTTAPRNLGVIYYEWVRDDAFRGLGPGRWAYRVSGESTVMAFGDVYSIDSVNGIDASILFHDSESSYGTSYSGTMLNVTYVHHF